MQKSMGKRAAVLLLAILLALTLTGCADAVRRVLSDAGVSDELGEVIGDKIEEYEEGGYFNEESEASSEAPRSESSRGAGFGGADGEAPDEAGVCTTKEDVSLYLREYGRLPGNFITKSEAKALGWDSGSLEPFAPGMCIGGDRFDNYEGLLPEKDGRTYTECDIDTLGADSRGAKRIVFSNDGLIYYSDDRCGSFTLLYGEE